MLVRFSHAGRSRMRRMGAVVVTAFLFEGVARAQTGAPPAKPTFYRDIAPIIDAHCASCHRPGGIGPFALIGYRDVQRRAQLIGAVVTRRIMPPWKADGPSGEFAGRRVLSETEIERITTWIAQGAK